MKYGLELEKRTVKVFRGVKEALTPHLNISQDKEPISNIHKSNNEELDVKVLTLFKEGDKNIFKESQKKELGNDHGNGEGLLNAD